MTFKNILLLFVAFSVAGLTAFMANNWIDAERQAMLANQSTVPVSQSVSQVLVVQDNLKAGNFVRAENLKWQSWPEDGLAESYALKGKRNIKDFVGAVVRNAIISGQPITDDLVVHPGDRGFLAAVLGIGNRAVSVPVNATSGIAGFIFPGDRVDLILTSKFNSKGADGKSLTRYVTNTLLRGIRVLAIDQKTESKNGEVNPAKTVTMEVSPKQAEKVAIGMAVGSLSLSLQSLARDEKNLDGSNSNQPVSDDQHGYTLDTEVNALVAGLASKGGKSLSVNVLRGDQAEKAAF
ncbi:MAG: Flp pilus assembly protein CpaB [Rhodospirillales bacterium]|nr:Flp pilus assembly protein CpaB [Rhodospirillales bacterium]